MSTKESRTRKRKSPMHEHSSTKRSPENNWRETRTAEQCLSHLCLSENLSDVSFTFKGDQHENVKLPTHKFVLSMRSTVFEAMFYDSLAEKGDTIMIEDVDPETMKQVLRYIYSDKPDLNGSNVLGCLYAAKKYDLTGCINQCSEFLENSIDANNVCSIHEQAVLYDMKPLQDICFDFILENASDVFSYQGFLELSHATLLNVLKQDELSVDEVDAFRAAVRWSKNSCKSRNIPADVTNIREALGKALFHIRFPVIPIEEFAKVVTPTGILTNEEQVILYQFNATKGSSPLGKFIQRERTGQAVAIDFRKYTSFTPKLHYGSYCLQMQYQYRGLHFGPEYQNISANGPTVKIKSISGTFLKYVKSITLGKAILTNYRTVENKISFNKPIEVSAGVTMEFHPDNTEIIPNYGSHRANIQENVKGQMIIITKFPAGLETISFVKS